MRQPLRTRVTATAWFCIVWHTSKWWNTKTSTSFIVHSRKKVTYWKWNFVWLIWEITELPARLCIEIIVPINRKTRFLSFFGDAYFARFTAFFLEDSTAYHFIFPCLKAATWFSCPMARLQLAVSLQKWLDTSRTYRFEPTVDKSLTGKAGRGRFSGDAGRPCPPLRCSFQTILALLLRFW